ncbi:uncharacterized protein [Henckelia pumila]|uniref:uncharacterized protein n=1 Tax=Henckelia pumila TaxID=405737 RepID=UPI003C6E6319
MEHRITLSTIIGVVRWIPPPPGYYKLNSDGCKKEGEESGIGGIIRDHTSSPVISYYDSIGAGTNIRAGLIAMKGLQICNRYNLFPLWLEVDFTAALAIIEVDTMRWDLSHTLTQIQIIRHGSNVRKSHVYMEVNLVAYELANMGLAFGTSILQPKVSRDGSRGSVDWIEQNFLILELDQKFEINLLS